MELLHEGQLRLHSCDCNKTILFLLCFCIVCSACNAWTWSVSPQWANLTSAEFRKQEFALKRMQISSSSIRRERLTITQIISSKPSFNAYSFVSGIGQKVFSAILRGHLVGSIVGGEETQAWALLNAYLFDLFCWINHTENFTMWHPRSRSHIWHSCAEELNIVCMVGKLVHGSTWHYCIKRSGTITIISFSVFWHKAPQFLAELENVFQKVI